MIRRIHVSGYKSLRDVDVTLQPLSVLFGPNAAGKSKFIDVLQLLSRIAGSRSLK
jgi:predicted ATPase